MIYELKKMVKKILFCLKRFGFREYHHFPFDTLAPMPLGAETALQNILSDCELLEYGTVRMSDGTLLGLARDGRLIPHDTDLDFDVFGTPESMIRVLAKAHAWTLGREVVYCGDVQQLTFYDPDHLIFDFVFWYRNGKFAVNYSERGYIRVQPVEFFIDKRMAEIGQVKGWIPANLEGWLECRYGSNWSVPTGSKSDWKAECGDLIKLGAKGGWQVDA